MWVSYDDVVIVEEALKRDLQEGRELTVASYIRDVFNSADRVDDWQPIDCAKRTNRLKLSRQSETSTCMAAAIRVKSNGC